MDDTENKDVKRIADLFIETLEGCGVERVYGITGDSANYITAAIANSAIRFIHTRHEEGAALAAAAEAQLTKKLAVCMGSCGPGSLHLVNGLYEANRNGVPVLAIATEIIQSEIGKRYIPRMLCILRVCPYPTIICTPIRDSNANCHLKTWCICHYHSS